MRVVGDFLKDRDNNFSLIRLIAALMLLLGHAFYLTDPLKRGNVTAFGIDYGYIALSVFFAISGFLLTASYSRKPSCLVYAESRFLRIFPGLVVCNLFTVLVIGLAFTRLPFYEYLADHQTWDYLGINSTLILHGTELQVDLPGVFASNPRPGVNGPLWTLAYEVWMYILLAFIGRAGMLKRQRVLRGILLEALILVLIYHFIGFETGATRLGFYFFAGVFVYLIREWLPMNGWLALALGLAAIASVGTMLYALIMPIAVVYCTFWLALVPKGWVRLYNRLGDYSYGTYLYGWPVQQSIMALVPAIQPWMLFGWSLPLTLLIASVSWHLVENPLLGCKGSTTRLIDRIKASWQSGRSQAIVPYPNGNERQG